MARIEEAIGRSSPFVKVQPPVIVAQRAPATSDTDYPKGQGWLDENASPSALYTHIGGGVWDQGGNALATTTVAGIVLINTDGTLAGADNSDVPTSLAVKTYADALAIAGAPNWSESVSGIGQLSTSAEATTGTNDDTAMTPLKVAAVFAAPPALGSGTPGAGSFTTLAASGLSSLSGSATILTGGTALNLASDASGDAVNIGTGAAARVITIGNVTGATQVVLNSGTAGIALASTGAGDITIDSDDTLLLDADGVLELNSSSGVIGIGNDADANNINIGTGAAARTITVGNSTGATSVVLESGTGAINIGVNAIAHTVTIGNMTGASALALEVGTGNFTLDGVGGSTYTLAASTTNGTVAIGGTSQTGTFTLGGSDGAMTMNIANANGVKTINVGSGVSGNTISVGNGVNTGAQIINLANGASAANSTVNVLSGNGSAGTQTCNILGGTRAGALNLATGAAAHVISVGSGSAGAVTVDTAAGISLDSATASNFTVTGAADLTLASSAGSVIVNGEEAVVDAIQLQSAAGGLDVNTALEINIDSSEAAVADAIRIIASAADGGIDIDAGTGGIAIDSTGAVSLDGAAASNMSVSGAGIDLTLASAAGRVVVDGGEAAADAVRITSSNAAGGVDIDAGTGGLTLDSTDAISLDAAAASNFSVSGASVDLTLASAAGSVNITAAEAAADAIVINASNAAGGIDLSTGGGSIDLSSSGFVTMAPATSSVAGNGLTINADVGSGTFTGQTTAAGAQATYTITNSQVSASSALFVTVTNKGANDARITMEQVKPAAGSFEVMTQNNGAAALNGDIIINFWVIA